MVRRWLHELEPVKYLKNIGHPDQYVFPANPTQRTYVVGEILRIRGDCRPRCIIPYGLGTQRESCKKITNFPTILG